MQELVRGLERDLNRAGFTGSLLMTTSFGGAWGAEEIAERPIYSVGSGPSMAPVAALEHARDAAPEGEDGHEDLLVCDTGGTTFDVALVSGGELEISAETWLGGRWIGHITGTRSVDVRSVGSGGGSIVWIDPGGLLRVGPRSAGSEPGPACYGSGGTQPTVTDAAVLLGYLEPDAFLGGRLPLDVEAARAAFAPVADELGLGLEESTAAALRISTENVAGAVREVTIARGIDPRRLTLVAGGGASGLTVVAIARALGCERVLLPRTAGALSACGGLFADLVSEFPVVRYAETRNTDLAAVNDALATVRERAEAFLERAGDRGVVDRRIEYAVEARYRQQVWELDVPLAQPELRGDADVTALEQEFHDLHRRTFAIDEPGQYLECLVWKARAVAELASPSLRRPPREADDDAVAAQRPAWFDVDRPVATTRIDGARLEPGTAVPGPAVVREPTTTLVVPPGVTARVTGSGDYVLDLRAAPGGARTPAEEAIAR